MPTRLFALFINKNSNTLNKKERLAAEILKNILAGYQNDDPDFVPNGVEQLAAGLYYLAFKRTNKKIVRIEEFINTDSTVNGNYKGSNYASIYEAIKETLVRTCHNPVMLQFSVTLQDCERAILVTLKTAATRIEQL